MFVGGVQPMMPKEQYVPHVNKQLQLNTLEMGGRIGMPNPFSKKVPMGGVFYAPGTMIRGNMSQYGFKGEDDEEAYQKKLMTFEKGGKIKKYKKYKKKTDVIIDAL